MCGICGQLAFTSSPDPSAVHAVEAMAGELARRGPDASGLWRQGGATLGHRRLSIIDLSDSAQQPMIDPHLGLTIVFNGCIYNYPELRKQLEGKGHRFFTHNSDTEVILKAYAQWGTRCVEHFNGMFAFAIVERDSGRVFMARDRLGIKPFYYSEFSDGGLRFASSLPALVKAGGVDTSIDPVALHHYMTFHSVVPPPHTILNGVRKLPPATRLTIHLDGRREMDTYWRPIFNRGDADAEEAKYSEEDWKRRLLHELGEAIQRRMVADVPVGVLLSGGLDSSLVVGMLADAGQRGLNTFSIGFESVGGEDGNEFKYSDIVANHFGTTHHKIEVDSQRALPAMEGCIRAMSEPMVSHDCIGFYLLSEEVSRHVKVVQSGQGADEVFAGYHWYPPMLDVSPDAALDTYKRHFFDRDHAEYLSVVGERYHGGDVSHAFVENHFAEAGAEHPADKALRIDSTIMLVDDPVKRVDNMTMAWGLEARVPFLDHELVDFAGRIPPTLKTRPMDEWERTGGKHILKEAAREVIPAEVIDRPKGYFPVPALKYLRGEYLDMVRDTLTNESARSRGLFKSQYIETLLSDPESHITPLRGSKLWQVALLERWLQTHEL